MSKANKMFEEIGYLERKICKERLYFTKLHDVSNISQTIRFNLIEKEVSVYYDKSNYVVDLNVLELNAIHKMAKYLGWFDEL